ncbi:MAG: hypothetical protein P0111_14385 [Nitrospira sp.]|nr:hypothetical protein [Nitrospira sp.]
MPGEPGTIDNLVSGLAGVFSPLREHIEDGTTLDLLAELGIQFPNSLTSDPGFSNAVQSISAALVSLPELTRSLSAAVEADDQATAVQAAFQIIKRIADLIAGFTTVANAIKANSYPGLAPADVNAFADALPKRLVEYLVIRQTEDALPVAAASLDFIGVFSRTRNNVGSPDPTKPPFTKRELHLGAISDLFKSPGDLLRAKYGWGNPGFDGRDLLRKLETLSLEMGLPALYTDGPVPTLDLVFLEIQPKTDVSPPGLRVAVHEPLKGASTFTTGGPEWSLEFATEAQAAVAAALILQSDGSFAITSPSAPVQGTMQATFRTKPTPGANAYILVGDPGKSRLEFQEFSMGLSSTLTFDSATLTADGDVGADARIKGGQLVIDLSEADGFIGTILSAAKFSTQFDIAMGVSRKGFYFEGSGGLEIQIPLHVNLAVVEIESLTVGIGLTPQGLPISLGADLKANLGPLTAVVENMGVQAMFAFDDDHKGNLGPLDVGFAFKPPRGLGLAVDTGVVKGGGYLYFDFEKEEYAGALELAVMDIVTVKAIGLVTTRMPDGSKGFSLLLIISAEFTGIQLGFGFTLSGLGGLLGLNRTMQLTVIATGVRTGGINSVMFPKDVVANAPRIISDLRVYFPPMEGRFLVGLMAKIGWGTPTLASISLGLIVEIPPGKIAILGVLKVALPAEEAALILIQVNFIGAIEPDKSRLWFFAELFESRVLFISIEGGMGLLVAWGDDANFVLSVGGFHPRFNPPPLPFPVPKRLAIDILNTPVSRIRVECYFAVTSNTVQFGARAELRLGFDELGIFGHVAFDALFQFSPFYFVIDISGSVELKVFGLGLFSIRLDFSLEGPTPWRAKGEGTLSLLFFDISADFDITWGDREDTSLPPIPVMPLLADEFNKAENWRAELPPGNSLLVSLRRPADTEGLVLHPVGALVVSQRRVPLDLDIAKVGSQKVADATRFTVKVTTTGLGKNGDRKEQFAMGQFLDLSNDEKLSRKGYELQDGGVVLSAVGRQAVSSRAVKRTVRYEMIIFDSKYKKTLMRFVAFSGTLFTHFLRGNSAAKSELSQATKKLFVPFDDKVTVRQEAYVVATNVDNKPVNPTKAVFASEAEAYDYMRAHTLVSPEFAGALHVIPAHEAVMPDRSH